MKKQLFFYIVIIVIFIGYNQFFQVPDARLNDIINILFASFLFLYIAYIAWTVLKKIKRASGK